MVDSSAHAPGLVRSLSNLGSTVVEILHTRLQLISTEIQEEKERLVEMVLYAVVGVFCLSFALFLLTLFVVVAFWDTYRLPVLAALTLLYLAIGIGAGIAFRNKLKAQAVLFAATLSEFRKDHSHLTPP